MNSRRGEAADGQQGCEESPREKEVQRIAHIGTWDWDISGNRLAWSDEIYRIFGLSPQQFAANYEAFLARVHPEDRSSVEQAVRRSLEAEDPYAIEHRILMPDGTERVVLERGEVYRDDEGRPSRMLGTVQDITERKRAEDELTLRTRICEAFLSEAEGETAYNSVLEIVLAALGSRHGVFGYLDRNGDAMIPSMTRHVWDECRVPEKRIAFPRHAWGDVSWVRAIKTGEPNLSNELAAKTPPGHIKIRRHMCAPIRNRGKVVGILEVANKECDYSPDDLEKLQSIADFVGPILSVRVRKEEEEAARREAETELREAMTELKRSNRDLEQFAYVASHDLQEPLRMVASYTQLLAKRYAGRLDKDADAFIGYAVDGAKRMQALIRDLLAFSRVRTKGKPFSDAHMNDVIDEVLADLRFVLREASAQVTRGDLPRVHGDPSQLRTLLRNLIGNAIKFRGRDEPEIRLEAEEAAGRWTFSVRDNGIGIDKRYHERIFVIFQRLHARTDFPGSGIGLSICKRIVERHGGRIWVESEPGEGSTFRFTLPAGREGGDG